MLSSKGRNHKFVIPTLKSSKNDTSTLDVAETKLQGPVTLADLANAHMRKMAITSPEQKINSVGERMKKMSINIPPLGPNLPAIKCMPNPFKSDETKLAENIVPRRVDLTGLIHQKGTMPMPTQQLVNPPHRVRLCGPFPKFNPKLVVEPSNFGKLISLKYKPHQIAPPIQFPSPFMAECNYPNVKRFKFDYPSPDEVTLSNLQKPKVFQSNP